MATFRKRESKSGVRWVAEVCANGNRKSKSFDTKRQAQSWALETEQALLKPQVIKESRTLGELFERYAEEVSVTKKGERWETLRLRALQKLPMAEKPLVDLVREDFEDYRAERLKSVKASTLNREFNLISSCLTEARRWRWMEHKPMADLKRPKDPPARDRRISQREIDAILLALGYSESAPLVTKQQMTALAFLFALETAMRAGEISGLVPERVFLEERYVSLADSKNGTARRVALSTEAVRLLERSKPWEEGKPVLQLSSGTLSSTFSQAVSRAGIEDLVFHDSRHEAITRLAGKLEVLDLARMVGHKNINELLTYYNKTASELAQQLD